MFNLRKVWNDNLLSPKLLYLTMNMTYFVCFNFRARYLKEQHYIETKEYGILAAVMSLVVFLAGFVWSYLADKIFPAKIILITTALMAAGTFQLFSLSFGEHRVLIATVVCGVYIFFNSSFIPLMDAYVMRHLKEKNLDGDLYGRQRMFGTIGFAIVTVIVAYSPLFPTVNYLIIIMSLLFSICVYFMLTEPPIVKHQKTDLESKYKSILIQKPPKSYHTDTLQIFLESNSTIVSTKPISITDSPIINSPPNGILLLLKQPKFLFLLLVVFLNGVARAILTHFIEPIQRNVFKTPPSIVGLSAVSGVLFEFLAFYHSKHLLRIFGVKYMLLISQGAMCLRCICYSFLPRNFEGSTYIPLIYELFKGASFGIMQNACVVWVTEMTTDDTKAIGQALYSGMFSGVAAFVGGMIGYAVQNIGVVPGLNSEEMINVEIERSILLLQITAWVSIFAFVLFVVKYAWIDRRQIKQKD